MTEDAPPRSGRYDSLGLSLHYLEWGDPDAPPVLLVHGGLDNAWCWSEVAAGLKRDFRVIALDLRGHGDSDWSLGGDYHMMAFLADLAGFTRDVIGRPFTLVGHSMGARISIFFTGAMPEAVERLVALEGVAGRRTDELLSEKAGAKTQAWVEARNARHAADHATQVGGWLRERAGYRRSPSRPYTDFEEVVERKLARPEQRLTRDQALQFARNNMRQDEEGRWSWKFDPAVRWHISVEPGMSESHSFYSRIECPVLHVYGEESWAYPPPAEDLACFRRSRLVTIPGAGHWSHLNQPGAVVSKIRAFTGRPVYSVS
jgi:pimeloyl-ACP methyl ester carboxylesterase